MDCRVKPGNDAENVATRRAPPLAEYPIAA
jgi:hypothetical protein